MATQVQKLTERVNNLEATVKKLTVDFEKTLAIAIREVIRDELVVSVSDDSVDEQLKEFYNNEKQD